MRYPWDRKRKQKMLQLQTEFEFHEVANLFPEPSEEEYLALKEDMKNNGQREPIWLWKGKIIDGRSRYRACKELGLTPLTKEWDGEGSLVAFVASLNLHRRHLSSSHRAAIALTIKRELAAEAKKNQERGGGDKKSANARSGSQIVGDPIQPINSAKMAAEATGTNPEYVRQAERLAEQRPDLLQKVKDGTLSLPEAGRQAAKEKGVESAPPVTLADLGRTRKIPVERFHQDVRGRLVIDLSKGAAKEWPAEHLRIFPVGGIRLVVDEANHHLEVSFI